MRATALIAALGLSLAACGADDKQERSNAPRPPTPINVTAAISDSRVSVSPRTFGAGPIVVIVSNQTPSPQTLTFETEEIGGAEPGLKQSTTPIDPRGTTTLQVDVREGTYAVSTRDGGIEPATVRVSGKRPSAQDELLMP